MRIDQLPHWTTHSYQRDADPRTRVQIATVECRPSNAYPTFVVIQGFQSWIEPFEMQRFQLIAHMLSARLIIVEVPGFGTAGSRLLRGERRALLAGDFIPLATRLLDAARSMLGSDERDAPLSLMGYSMGASVVSAMAAVIAAAGQRVHEVILVEPVAMRRWRIRDLLAASRRENRLIPDCIAANDTIAGTVAPWDQRPGVRPPTNRRTDVMILGAALRFGRLVYDVIAATSNLEHVIIVRGNQSELSRLDSAAVVTALRQRGITVDELTVPGHHAFWHALPSVHLAMQRIRDSLNARRNRD